MSRTTELLSPTAAGIIEKYSKRAGLHPPAAPAGRAPDNLGITAPPAAEPGDEWPNVLPRAGEMYSSLFPDEWAMLAADVRRPDFPVPTFRDYPFPDELASRIPKNSDYQSDPVLLYDAVAAWALGSVTHLVGHPGTGKSNGLPVRIAARLGLPLLRVGLNKKGMMLEDLVGREGIANDGGVSVTRHKDGLFVKWLPHPCIVLADEFSRASVEITNGLMSVMERGGSMYVENREGGSEINRHAHCWILASDNVKGLGDGMDRMVGCDQVDAAILSRFEITLEVDYLPEAAQAALIDAWFPGFPKKTAEHIAKFAGLVQGGYKRGELPLSISPRELREIARYACLHRDVATAVRKVTLARYSEPADIEAIRQMYRTVFVTSL